MSNKRPPTVIYLPSSGGYTGSRIVSESEDRRRFPFRRYSFDEDGGLVVRTRNVSRDNRTRPYVRHTVRFSTPVSRSGSLSEPPEAESPQSPSSPRQDDRADLLKTLVPALIRDPAMYKESISSICTSHNIDPSVVSAIKSAVEQGSSSRPLERTTSGIAAIKHPVGQGSSSRPLERRRTPDLPAASSHIPISKSGMVTIKQDRPFPSGSPGVTTWYSSYSVDNIDSPPSNLNPNVGDLYIHTNRAEDFHHIWLFGLDTSWSKVAVSDKVYHPVIADRVLSLRANGTPSWITAASYTTIKGRKDKARAHS
ncbi:hypothetical protein BJ322DRAFT_1105307 [Thelephora terrestris]|uniref:Uncharacterized protein n=1 Tax=Thelephora terrestris TaxID=56493 RepID=A0A9P6HLF2_9AGAM|nr:hypothetical protein BJ322DRAFT_1114264 [Thelephora terrestris]KAF9789456.1 hypothetical protein BJ322DRAFT_1105307 [Thelephora terrestris]